MTATDLRRRQPGTHARRDALAIGVGATAQPHPQRGRLASLLEANRAELSLLLAARPEVRVLTLPVLLHEATTWGA